MTEVSMRTPSHRLRNATFGAALLAALGFGAGSVLASAPSAALIPFPCGLRPDDEACRECCIDDWGFNYHHWHDPSNPEDPYPYYCTCSYNPSDSK
jgi:hypothetical protein